MKREAVSACGPIVDVVELVPPAGFPLFDRILVANRGEIACRIIKTARRMGIATVAVYSEVDRNAEHVAMADDALWIGAGSARESYLDAARIMDACRRAGVNAVHPGYGFLSENAEFAQLIEDGGFSFIGPSPRSIALMGDKIAAKALAVAAGVNVIAGCSTAIESNEQAAEVARSLGYPVIVKASAGGGGRGLRIARTPSELDNAVTSCRSEALSSFGDDRVFIERLVPAARHVEVQILADAHGNCVHLWERECSIQRRHQKLIEEAPSPFIDEDTRTSICEQAVALARAADYRSAGTVEFLVEGSGAFYFLEMNTRLQVEHPVTECLTGLDLVEQMIRVAAGERLAFGQADVRRNGWAMECRINADNPARNFLPSAGRLIRYQPPAQTMWASDTSKPEVGIRVDSGVREGDTVSTHYDSMLGKLIALGKDRADCIRMMREALDAFVIRGISSNVGFQAALLAQPDFRAGQFDTNFIAENYEHGFVPSVRAADEGFLLALSVAVHMKRCQRSASVSGQLPGFAARVPEDYIAVVRGADCTSRTPVSARTEGDTTSLVVLGQTYAIKLTSLMRDIAICGEIHNVPFRAQVEPAGLAYDVSHNGSSLRVCVMSPRASVLDAAMPARQSRSRSAVLLSPMPGRLVDVAVLPGQQVRAGEKLAVVEAMKMENVLLAEEDGVVVAVEAMRGDTVAVDQVILRFK